MNVAIARTHFPVTALGPGRRIGVWFQGCSIRCPGCMARDTWDAALGQHLELDELLEWIRSVPDVTATGVTISGGEPFDQPDALASLVRWLRVSYCTPDQDILVFSGHSLEQLLRDHAQTLEYVDALVSEPFISDRPLEKPMRWRGSSNQILAALSDLGRRRYDPLRDAASLGELQIGVSEGRLWMIGVPRPGDLARLEASLAQKGVVLEGASWR
jgi:anaerobic ribonucleoside-triphosphate reductase activating protein